MKKNIFLSVLILCIACLAGCNSDSPRTEKQIVKAIITSFDIQSDNGGVDQLLKELEGINPNKAKTWENICNMWSLAYKDDYVNANILPDTLPNDNSLGIVVLGYALNSDGSMKKELIGRLNTAYECALKYPNSYIIMTGGGTASFNKSVTEADAMAEWMRNKGINSDRIIIENRSLTTMQNASYTLKILSESYPSVSKLAMVTSDYHIPWGVIDFYATIQYDAYNKNSTPAYEIISNAGYMLDTPTYSRNEVIKYIRNQLWELES